MTENPFATRPKLPSVSWANVPVGTTITGRVTDPPSEVQHRDFLSGALETWDDGQPKLAVVINLDIEGDERKSLWCIKQGSAMYAAIRDAVQNVGAEARGVEVGGWLRITYTGDKPPSRPGLNPSRQFAADYSPPNAFSGDQPAPTQQPAYGGQGNGQTGYQERRLSWPAPNPQHAPQQPAQHPAQQPAADPWAPAPQPADPPF